MLTKISAEVGTSPIHSNSGNTMFKFTPSLPPKKIGTPVQRRRALAKAHRECRVRHLGNHDTELAMDVLEDIFARELRRP